MKSIRKSLCLVLSMCMLASASLVGCNNNPSNSSSSGASSASTAASSKSKEPVQIKIWSVGNAQNDQKRVTDAINKYLKDEKKSNISITFDELGYDAPYNNKVNTALNTGSAGDIVFTANWAANFRMNASNGNFKELDSYLTKYPDIVTLLDKAFIDASKVNGHTYALPCNKEKFHYWGYLLKDDLCKEMNLDVSTIKKEADLEPYFQKVLDMNKGITPLAIAGTQDIPGWKFLDWDNFSDDDIPGALYPAESGKSKVINQFTAPESIAFYKKMKEYVAKKYVKANGSTLADVVTEAKTNKYFAFVQSLKPDKAAEMQQSTKIKWQQVGITEPYITNRETTGAMLAIPKQCAHPDEAMEIINMFYTDAKFLNMFVYGEEGKDYTKNSDGTVTLVDKAGYASGAGWRFGDQLKNYRLTFEAPDKYQQFEKLNKSSKKLQSLGFVFDSKPVEQKLTALKPVIAKYYKQLFCGSAADVDAEVAKFDKEMKQVGSEDVIAEMQKQYDAWAAKKS